MIVGAVLINWPEKEDNSRKKSKRRTGGSHLYCNVCDVPFSMSAAFVPPHMHFLPRRPQKRG